MKYAGEFLILKSAPYFRGLFEIQKDYLAIIT